MTQFADYADFLGPERKQPHAGMAFASELCSCFAVANLGTSPVSDLGSYPHKLAKLIDNQIHAYNEDVS